MLMSAFTPPAAFMAARLLAPPSWEVWPSTPFLSSWELELRSAVTEASGAGKLMSSLTVSPTPEGVASMSCCSSPLSAAS